MTQPVLPHREPDQWYTVFSGNPFDRVDGRRSNADWVRARLADPSSRFLLFDAGRPVMCVGDHLDLLWCEQAAVRGLLDGGRTCVLLGMRDGVAHFAIDAEGADDIDVAGRTAKAVDLRSVAVQLTRDRRESGQSSILAQARSLLEWHRRRAFCSVCGHPAGLVKAGYARRCLSDACGAEHFPRTDPVVIMLGLHGDQCLLGRHAGLPENLYSALAGFVEPGEAIEEAVRRELMEEAGVTAGRVRYVASQPWPFPSSLMIGCFAEIADPAITIDATEIEAAHWFSAADARAALAGKSDRLLLPPPIAIAHQLVSHWLEENG